MSACYGHTCVPVYNDPTWVLCPRRMRRKDPRARKKLHQHPKRCLCPSPKELSWKTPSTWPLRVSVLVCVSHTLYIYIMCCLLGILHDAIKALACEEEGKNLAAFFEELTGSPLQSIKFTQEQLKTLRHSFTPTLEMSHIKKWLGVTIAPVNPKAAKGDENNTFVLVPNGKDGIKNLNNTNLPRGTNPMSFVLTFTLFLCMF